WARRVTLHKVGPGEGGEQGTEHAWLHFLEIALNPADVAKVSDAIRVERQRRPRGRRVLWLDFPVVATQEQTLRLRWSDPAHAIRPRIEAALDFISHFAEVKPAVRERVDYTVRGLSKLDDREQRRRLAELARLDPVGVVRVAKEVRKISTTEAMEFVKGL
ncbi:MAG TPA: hypothetical protein VMD30_07135, partial [Tepidisphaeraceae bacterium]|nr:hypothetical protein [Tepidisphaeraceae bacterium]